MFSTLTIWAVHFQQQQERDASLHPKYRFLDVCLIYLLRRPCTEGCCVTMNVDARNLGREKKDFVHLNAKESCMNRFKRSSNVQMSDSWWYEVRASLRSSFSWKLNRQFYIPSRVIIVIGAVSCCDHSAPSSKQKYPALIHWTIQ